MTKIKKFAFLQDIILLEIFKLSQIIKLNNPNSQYKFTKYTILKDDKPIIT